MVFTKDTSASLCLDLDKEISRLNANKQKWAELPAAARIDFLRDARERTAAISETWIEEDVKARRVSAGGWDKHTSITAGPLLSLRLLRLYINSLISISEKGAPALPGLVKWIGPDQLAVQIYPADFYDKLILRHTSGEIWLKPGCLAKDLNEIQASAYDPKTKKTGRVGLILGAGNLSGIGVSNILYKMFVSNEVVLFKVHPALRYMKDILSDIFQSLIKEGFLSIAGASSQDTDSLCLHPEIDELHVTGSIAHFKEISSMLEAKGQQHKTLTAELGNVTPVILVPGPWSESDISYHAESLCSGLTVNSGFNCTANRLIIQGEKAPFREPILSKMRTIFEKVPVSTAFYPGAEKTIREVVKRSPEAHCIGQFSVGRTPWVMLTHLDPSDRSSFYFQNEVYGSFIGETSLPGNSSSEFIRNAVDFCNENLWGTLTCQIVVHPSTFNEPGFQHAFEKALRDLRYGTVSVNHFPAISFFLGGFPWGAFHGSSKENVQSGLGAVNNPYMLDMVEKCVIKGPFKMTPKPFWFPTHSRSYEIARRYLEFEKKRNFISFMNLAYTASLKF